MRAWDVVRAWGCILRGYAPALSIEITKECPLSCPGCYAFQPEHVGGLALKSFADLKGAELVRGVTAVVERHRPIVVYLVGGEPLVRYRELGEILPRICEREIDVRVVTSAVRPIPLEWSKLRRLAIVVSIDGLQPEHDQRRKPATYERILKHIEGHRIVVHATVTSHMMGRDDYLEEFVRFWSERPEVHRIQVSFYTPQMGEDTVEILTREMRERAVRELNRLIPLYPKIQLNAEVLKSYLNPPKNPQACLFARVTRTLSADLKSEVKPCQFGGTPNCSECGCLGSMVLHAVGERRLPGGVKFSALFEASEKVGSAVRWARERCRSITAGLGSTEAPARPFEVEPR